MEVKVVLASRSEEKLKLITDDLKAKNYEAYYIITDVNKEKDCKNLIDKLLRNMEPSIFLSIMPGYQCWHHSLI